MNQTRRWLDHHNYVAVKTHHYQSQSKTSECGAKRNIISQDMYMTMQYKIMINNNSKDKYIEDNLWNNQETLASLKISGIPDTTRYPHNTLKKEEKS